MKSVLLTAFPRTLTRRSGVKKLRQSGKIPAIIYGRHSQPQNLEINVKDIEHLIHHSVSENVLVDLSVSGDPKPKRLALVQQVQHHALSGKVLHVDLHEVAETETVTVMVPVESFGDAVGVKNGGGVLEHVLFKIKVKALPKDLPEVITVDVTNLEIGQSIHVGDIKPPPGVEILGEKTISVLAVAAPITEAQEAAAVSAATGPAELEVLKEKKDDTAPEGAKPAEKGAAKPAEKTTEKAADKGGGKKPEKKK